MQYDYKTIIFEQPQNSRDMKQYTVYFSEPVCHKYKGSCITKTWANGDWENLGEIKLAGSNKTFVANTKQRVANY